MTMLQSHATATIGIRDYDPEIKDMASYVHTHKIDSDLAVRFIFVAFSTKCANSLLNSV